MERIIVIGAGILGASTAYHLAKKGADVTVIDRRDKGQATDAAAGIVCPWLSQRRNKAWYSLAKGGAAFYPSLISSLEKEGETDTGYARVGAISVRPEHKTLVEIEKIALKRRVDAPEIGDIQVLGPAEAQKLFPPLAEGYGAVYASGAARVNGRKLRDALLRAAERHGARIIFGDASFMLNSDRLDGVKTEGDLFRADTYIVTAGAWAKELLRTLGIEFRVKDLKAQIIHMKLLNEKSDEWPVIIPPGNQYIVPFENGRIVAGATYENFTHFDIRVTAGGMHEILHKALDIAPGLADSTILETRVGFRPYTPGSLPVIGPLPGYGNVLVGNGLGATGLTAGPLLGSVLANIALGQQPGVDVELYHIAGAIQQ
ncbi:D-amino-acid dehydrogenase [Bacillus thermophilus]|uniref:D-amino-acid dehydrogenase n=1 Tax=Siminovitchia thermophila TaxID=1245522 RepID=A0ABS2R7X8_9BACI|nr:FAD-binding oxidoreductase [Siminovitchia thermophila]MBM7715500.1 D-amino-acid dehydrogenase [Siminovitchia thermophila]ONK21409.1 oxidoreductase [Bacillus sp. VT-16-64]